MSYVSLESCIRVTTRSASVSWRPILWDAAKAAMIRASYAKPKGLSYCFV
ncbi:uncharacterized protein RSE6_05614 [Rhynchosporium secalis]|uniref:Uncharacterized protein n=1 Tax=Rhynchosporium secalis TaxID=38038 RepID=A0A1E1M895_RHYSE|nr:uncharacterized protein RSE6_05614 [Rhynchosporium secalis]